MTDPTTTTPSRRAELANNLARMRERVAQACTRAGRAADEVELVAVTKTFPADDVRLLRELGVRDIGENRDQEASAKAAACADLDVRWHFVGQLQTNKARSVVGYASVVHSVDRMRLVRALAQAMESADPAPDESGERAPLRCLVQVQLDDSYDARRGGARPEEVLDLAAAVAAADRLELGGLMTVAPLDADPRRAFARLGELSTRLRASYPEATWLSAGMSEDLEPAIESGATHVRVGRALLGVRPVLR